MLIVVSRETFVYSCTAAEDTAQDPRPGGGARSSFWTAAQRNDASRGAVETPLTSKRRSAAPRRQSGSKVECGVAADDAEAAGTMNWRTPSSHLHACAAWAGDPTEGLPPLITTA